MELSVFSLLFLSFFASSFSLVRSQDSCSSNLAVSSQIPFYKSSFKCFTAWSSQSFILRYAKTSNNTWSFVLSAPDNNAYIAIGFSSNGKMIGSSAMVGWVSSGKGTSNQYYLNGFSSSSCPPGKGNLNVVKSSIVVVSQSSVLYLAFEITVDQPTPYLVYAIGPKGSLPSSSSSYLSKHQDMASASFNANAGSTSGAGSTKGGEDGEDGEDGENGGSGSNQSAVSVAEGDGGFGDERKHALLVILGWGVLVPIGVLAARYFKSHDPHWFYGHVSIQTIGFGLGLAGIIMGFDLEGEGLKNYDTHKALGIAVLVFGCLQVAAFLARPNKTSKVRKYWNWYHHNIGRLAIAIAIANIFLGLSIAEESKSWYVGFGAFLGVWVIVALLLEIRYWIASDDRD